VAAETANGSVGGAPAGAVSRSISSRTVSASSIEILTGKDDRLLRRLRLSVALDIPPELRPKTGGTTALEVKVDMALREVNRPVRVSALGG